MTMLVGNVALTVKFRGSEASQVRHLSPGNAVAYLCSQTWH